MLFFFTINNEHIHLSVFLVFVFAFTISFAFSRIMKALVLQEMQGSSFHLDLQI